MPDGAPEPAPDPIIIGGAGRSGTTLLRMMLDAHPRIACGPEMKVISIVGADFQRMVTRYGEFLFGEFELGYREVAASYGAQILSLLEAYRRKRGRARVAEKTPSNVQWFLPLTYMLPRAYLVQLIRDGRDVVCSLLKQDWVDLATGQPVAYTRDAGAAARYWVESVNAGRSVDQNAAYHRYIELRYEDLVTRPEPTMRALLERVGEPWDPAVLAHDRSGAALPEGERASHGDALSQPVNRRALGRWERELSSEQQAAVKAEAGALLIELGYCDDLEW